LSAIVSTLEAHHRSTVEFSNLRQSKLLPLLLPILLLVEFLLMVPFEWQFLTHIGLSRASNVQGDFSCFGAKIGDFCRWSVETTVFIFTTGNFSLFLTIPGT
jgi:hypothetical protein